MHYYDIISKIHALVDTKSYVEIGVRNGESLHHCPEKAVAVGIDPEPDIPDVRANEKIFAVTSDDFFANHNLTSELEYRPLDVAFIDGMHLYEFVLRDFINVERYATEKTTIILHDILPIDEETSARERATSMWTGDVWKIIFILQEYRPDLKVQLFDSFPSGLGIVTGFKGTDTTLYDKYDEILEKYTDMPFSYLLENKRLVQEKIIPVEDMILPIGGSQPSVEQFFTTISTAIEGGDLSEAVAYYETHKERFSHIPEYQSVEQIMKTIPQC